jgi:short-subunit dehydrogenase
MSSQLCATSAAGTALQFQTLYSKTAGKMDVLINNAGLFAQGISETYTPEQVREMFEVNVFGIQRVTRAALPEMRKKRSGLIVNIGSILGRVTIPFIGLYGASKFAVEALTESYRYELSQLGIKCSVDPTERLYYRVVLGNAATCRCSSSA